MTPAFLNSACNTAWQFARSPMDGEIREKRGNTQVKMLRKFYSDDFAPGVRSDTRLDTLRKRACGESLSKIVKG
jgi:hypothetical protein